MEDSIIDRKAESVIDFITKDDEDGEDEEDERARWTKKR